MKNVFMLIVLVSFSSAVTAQSNINPKKDYSQKKYFDSLQKIYEQPAILINSQPLLVYNIPVVPLINDGEKTGMSEEDTIYTMKTDNMMMLKPNTKTTYMPNAIEGKIFMLPTGRK